jgi:hypothetical protein
MHAAAARVAHPDPDIATTGLAHLRSITVVDPARFARSPAPGWPSQG